MRAAIIAAAGLSSRFNEGLPEEKRQLKAIYHEPGSRDTLLWHLAGNCSFADEIIIVGGYRYESLKEYAENEIADAVDSRVTAVYNSHYKDLSSGYSFYTGLEEAFSREGLDEILFVEGDLDIDRESFQSVIACKNDVLTYNREPIYSGRAVVLYQTGDGRYRYAYNSSHGLLEIGCPFRCILNSGQLWKFTDMKRLKLAAGHFLETDKSGTNLLIIQDYLDRNPGKDISLAGLDRWTNCNTREDFDIIRKGWDRERERIEKTSGCCGTSY